MDENNKKQLAKTLRNSYYNQEITNKEWTPELENLWVKELDTLILKLDKEGFVIQEKTI